MGTRRFVGPVIVEQEAGWWVVRKPFAYLDELLAIRVDVPKGTITDFASVPKLFWNLAPPDDYEYSAAAIVHDRLYATHEKTKQEADAIFFNAMSIHGTPLWKRRVMWAAVHYFGGSSYATGPARQAERLKIEAARRAA